MLEAPQVGLPDLWGERKLAVFLCRVVWSGKDGGSREVQHIALNKLDATNWLHQRLQKMRGALNLHGWIEVLP